MAPAVRRLFSVVFAAGVLTFLVFTASSWHRSAGEAALLDVLTRCDASGWQQALSRLLRIVWSPVSAGIVGAALAVVVARDQARRAAAATLLATPVAVVVSELLKYPVHREYAGSLSFPSAHASAAAAIVVVAGAVASTSRPSQPWVLITLAVLTGVLGLLLSVAMARTCVHLPNDVAGGTGLGVAVAAALVLLGWRGSRPDQRRPEERASRTRS